MPLKLKDVTHPSATTTLNTWADGQEQTVTSHTQQIKTLTNTLRSLLTKNPSLVIPNGIKI